MDQCTLHNCRDSFQDHNLSLTVVFLFHSFMGRTVCFDGVRSFPNGDFQSLHKLQLGPCTAARTDLGSCNLGNCTFGMLPLGKIPMESCHLGKCLWESTKHRLDKLRERAIPLAM